MAIMMTGHAFSQQLPDYHPLTVDGGARSAALGGVSAAEAFDPNSMYGNPAALLFIERRFLAVNHVQEVPDPSMSEGAAFAFPASREDMIGVGLTLTHTGNLNQTVGPALQFMQYGMDIAYARAVTPTLGLGGRIGASTAESGMERATARSWSAGCFYSPTPGSTYGLVYTGISTRIDVRRDQPGTALVTESVPASLGLGLSLQYPSFVGRRLLVLAVADEKSIGESGSRYKVGFEVYPVRTIALRAGYIALPGAAAAHYGAGFITDRIEIDYAISPNNAVSQFHEISLLIGL
ncbi:MAG TPA: hypothetical protein VES59_03155 [Bacteroidota bacterium]|nr:hypothetical protein [Bacteroidota bacterium]